MPRKSTVEIQWPVGGVDRSVSYQNQPPFTTPDALNVRTEDSLQFRERGGSRPGLDLAIRTDLLETVRLITKVSVLRQDWGREVLPYFGTQLRDTIIIPYQAAGTYVPAQGQSQFGSGVKGLNYGNGLKYTTGINTLLPYEISVHVRPSSGEQMEGSATINFGLAAVADNPEVDGNVVTLTFTAGTYQATLSEWATTVETVLGTSAVFSDSPNAGGTLSVKVTPGTGQVQVFWRSRELLDVTATTLFGRAFTTQFQSADESIILTELTLDTAVLMEDYVPKSARRDLLVAVADGDIYLEDTVNDLKLVTGLAKLRADVELTATDREQLLYIADYGAVIRGDSGSFASGSYATLNLAGSITGVDQNFSLAITDSDYTQNEIQTLTITGDGGTFKVAYLNQITAALAWDITGANLQTALVGLSTIGSGNVSVSGDGPYDIEFIGSLAALAQTQLDTDVALLTDSIASAPAADVVKTQFAGGSERINGTYQIVVAVGSTIAFYPTLPVSTGFAGTISSVEYNIVRTPKVFDPKLETLAPHRATAGSVPAGCRLVALYRDRIVYAASDIEPHVWYMSRQGDPDDWDYGQEDSGAAVFAQSSVAGQLADPITALIAHGDECLIIGCYGSLWIIRGDPGYGGTLDQLSRKVGIVGPNAWCRTADDMCVFLSADGLYTMAAGCAGFPVSLSRERLPDELLCSDPNREVVTLEYDSLQRGIHIMLTRYDESEAAHWWFDWEAKSFWRVKLQTDHEPFSLHERTVWNGCSTVLLGGRDGFIRAFDREAVVDDGDNEIESYCTFGPFHLDKHGFREGILSEIQGTLGKNSGPVTWSAHVGLSAEEAYLADARETGEWARDSLNYNSRPRARGVSAVVKLTKKAGVKRRWFLERMAAVVRSAGRLRVR